MTVHTLIRKSLATIAGALVLCLQASLAFAAATALSDAPMGSSSAVNAKPNIMFVLDDSGSMRQDYLPDWAGPYQVLDGNTNTMVTVTPAHRFFNRAFNGVAYHPGTYYQPPVMYTSLGLIDTATYPSMTGQSAATGGDGAASAGTPNWRAVKVDGYGIQSNATANLEGQAYSYTTIAGEYCDSKQLRNCVAASAPTASYPQPAYLRWCSTSAASVATTTAAGTLCQAGNIDDNAANIAAGVTPYTYARMARPATATVTVNGTGSVTSLSVDGQAILSASASGGTMTDVATAIATQINACTYTRVGNCTTIGFSAVSLANVVTITAPTITTSSPVVSGGTTAVTAFTAGSVPGGTIFTVISPFVTSYPYPGSAAKAANRIDCAGTTCTYAEEMTNYANWYAYYRTRMQMMKTAASIAFSNVDDSFRVGYYAINNGAGSDFINLAAFDGAQKNLWYQKFFSATPYGTTPLRGGLASAGRVYAGKIATLNGVTVADPVQYSCQQNYTILSTDGYWNDTTLPPRIDGTTPVGQQDGNDPRPFYDGATQTRTVSQTTKTDDQQGINTFLVESMTQQQQASRSQLDQTVVTTDIYPWTTHTSRLRTRTQQLNETDYGVVQSTYPLTSVTKQLQESTYKLNSTPRILQSYIRNLTKTTTPLEARTYKVTKSTQLLTKNIYKVTVSTQKLTQDIFKVRVGTRLVTKDIFKVTIGTQLVTRDVFNVTRSTFPLQSSTYKLQSSTRQLQKYMETSSDGGDTWQATGWVNASSCTVAATGPGYTRNTQCRYNTAVVAGGLSTCTSVSASPGPTNYTVAQAVSCAYETTPTVANAATCTVVAQGGSSPYSPAVACGYSATATIAAGQTSCTARDQTGSATMSGDKVTCVYDGSATRTTGLSTCTRVVPSPTASSPKTDCTYQSATNQTGQNACTAAAPNNTMTNGQVVNTAVTCSYDATSTQTTGLSTCTRVVPAVTASSPKTDCTYQSQTFAGGQSSCTAAAQNTNLANGQVVNTAISCAYDATSTQTTNLSTCTRVVPAVTASSPKTDCTYQAATNLAGQTSCTAAAANTNLANGQVANTAISCAYDASSTQTTGLSTCTRVIPAVAASSSLTTCTYQSASNLAGQASCTAVAANNTVANGQVADAAVSCAYDAAPSTTLTNQGSCTWVVPAVAASVPRTDCVYNAGAATTATVGTCTTVAASTGTANNTVWSGPAVACAYQAAVLTGTNLTTCTAGTASAGPTYNAYTTCGYINGTTTTGLNSCTYVADSTGPVYAGPANACAYSGTATVANVASCTAVAQSGTFAAPQKTCAYEAVGTSATNLASCTAVPQSTGAYPWAGPNVTCAYSGSATVTTPASCTVNVEAGPSYTSGAKVSCAYAAGVPNNNVASCNVVAKQTAVTDGAVYTAASDCAYASLSTWSWASAACVPQAASAGSPYVGPARECNYTAGSPQGASVAWSADTYAATCTDAPKNNVNLTARECVATPYPVEVSNITSVVDTCDTTPTNNGASPVPRTTATTCAYRAPVVSDAASCTPVAASGASPYVTAVTCPVTNSAQTYVGVVACTPAGTPPAAFDASGRIVVCRKTDIVGTTTNTPPDFTNFTPVISPPVASCTPGIDGAMAQTRCTTLLHTGPDPVEASTCVTVDPGLAPDYVKTTCDTTTTTSTVMGCTPQAGVAPLWQTATCVDNGDGTSNTLADVAAYYYKNDLRAPTLGNCTGAVVPPATAGSVLCTDTDAMNNVRASASDPANWQHMTTFTLGLGASGYMRYSDTYLTDAAGDFPTVKGVSPYAAADGIAADPANGVCSWQTAGNCNWPFPASDEQTAIDDLWHAAVNGHAAYYSAGDPASLSAGITSALNGVAAAQGSVAAPALSTPNFNANDNYVFSSTYVSLEWYGELARYRVDPFTGIIAAQPDWSAQAKLDARTASSRNIYTFDNTTANKLKAFTSANFGSNAAFNTPNISQAATGLTQYLCTSPTVCLSSANQTLAAGAKLVDYLRGDRTYEGTETDNTSYYRQRLHILGDMVNSQSVYVSQPTREYGDKGYAGFKTASATTSRKAVVYVGANDGMLHAFAAKGTATTEALVDAYASAYATAAYNPTATNVALSNAAAATASAAVAADTTIGQELWAYIPSMVLPNLYKLADKKYRNQHRYFVDATPVVGDVCTSACDTDSATWKTILVGGLGHGGRGYYALDITDPDAPKALWEFTHTNLGYSYGNPQIAKRACLVGDLACQAAPWVVIFSSGYNNIPSEGGGDGVGRLFILDAQTGVQVAGSPNLSPISTGSGSVSNPSGLAQISAMVTNPQVDATISAVYGGDLDGKLWRFDVNNNIAPAGYEAQLLAHLKDAAGNPQPITTKPAVTLIKNQRVVYIGTGRFLHSDDIGDTSQQSLYAIKDAGTATADPTTAIFDNPAGDRSADAVTGINGNNFVVQTQSYIACPANTAPGLCDQGSQIITSTNYPTDFLVNNGWAVDLINASERSNNNPALALGLLVFATNAPTVAACDIGGKSYLYFLDYLTGGPIYSPENPGGVLGYLFANAFASAPAIASTRTAGGDVGRPVVIVGTEPGAYRGPSIPGCTGSQCTQTTPPGMVSEPTRRMSWRELIVGQ